MQTQSQPILKNTNGFKMSIIRFTLNTETLPVFIPTMKSTADSTTIYSFTMDYNGISYQQYMVYQPQNLNSVDPDEYYYIYSYQFLIYLVNNCIASCLTGLSAITSLQTDVSPVMSFDPNTKKCTLTLDNTFFGYNEANKINIYMNYAMYSIFASLPASQVNLNYSGKDYQVNNTFTADPTVLQQDYSTVALWNPVSSVIFTSNLLPIYQSNTPPIQTYVEGSLSNNSTNSNFMNILTDFIADDLEFTPYIQYAPSLYRYLSLKPNTEVRNLDLQVYWQNKNNGMLKPLYIATGGSASVKIFLTTDY
ncbi:MAG: hypothetical protein EOO43_00585 [Flavobacterium sp.]|nr:MAG: hypothetical protein EOO43_00585 [Flavobacterium sp.]